jgi:hypothetical protein
MENYLDLYPEDKITAANFPEKESDIKLLNVCLSKGDRCHRSRFVWVWNDRLCDSQCI